ncbi:hypothetical protein [Nitrosomonas sp.]|uniref:hypothetical protein n=1 Tax=Nitrosomonas sp. TaxID=42353 RepID=UPI0028520598|nr:hypothetical protein [Nitrosomonas sp.]MDR4515162.1 hypothetical protein [Nitrosomonas sp.]
MNDISEDALTTNLPGNHLQQQNYIIPPITLILTEDGTIVESNKKGKKLLDYSSGKSGKKHISKLVPLLAEVHLLDKGNERVNPYLRFLSRIGYHFKLTGLRGRKFAGELFFSDITFHNQHLIMIMIFPSRYESRH